MTRFYHDSRREILPGNIVTSYEEFKNDLQSQGLLKKSGFDDKNYSSSELYIDLEYMGWHEDNTVGELTVRIYPEDRSDGMDTLKMRGISRLSVENILEGKEIVEEDQMNQILGDSYNPADSGVFMTD